KRTLDSDNLPARARMAAFMEESAAAGAIGIGHAPGYMGSQRTHIGGGEPEAVWGEGNSRKGAPGWGIEAFEHGRGRALKPKQFTTALSKLRGAAPADGPSTQVAEETDTETVGTLAGARKLFADEVKDAELRRLLAASTAAEVGGQGPKAEQYYLESV